MFSLKIKVSIDTFPFKILLISLFLVLAFSFYGTASAATWYVNKNISASGDGTSWNNAFLTIHEALSAASDGDEIWVKEGTYSLSSQITVNKAVAVYGGFAGAETQRDQRDWVTNVTTIDGQDSVYHCFYVTADATIDGLTITGGNANGDVPDYRGGGIYNYQSSPSITNCLISENSAELGGGIYNRESSPTVKNCIFTDNSAVNYGGAIENYQSSPTIDNCTISENTAQKGGGIYNDQSSPTISNCTLSKNNSTESGGGIYSRESSPTITDCNFKDNASNFGGGVLNGAESPSTIKNCSFTGNTVTTSGGGMYNDDNSTPTITNCTLSNNSAKYGGGMYNDDTSSPTIINCTIYGNSATNYGGGTRNKDASTPTITNCILWANTAPDGPGIYNDDTSTPIITYCDIQGVFEGEGNINADPLFVDPSNNNFHLKATSPCIDKGTNSAAGIPNTDFDGDSRIIDGDNDGTATVDMGADEYAPSVTADGDVAPLGNRDGKVDVGDALVALRFALLLETPTQEDIHHGDVAPLDTSGLPHPDGKIDVGDALVILRKALGMISLEPTEISGIWGLYTTTTGETQEDGPMIIVLVESDGTLSFESMDLDGTWITGAGTISDTQISLSWKEEGTTVSLTGAVTNDTMSGTWTDTSGGSGTWRAEQALDLGEVEISFPETGDVLITIKEEFGLGSATFYGTETEQGPALPLTGFTMTTTEGDFVVSLDDQERPLTMSLGTMVVAFTYNEDDSFNYEMEEDGVLIYSGSALSVGNENTSKTPRQSREIPSIARDYIRNGVAKTYSLDPNNTFVLQMSQNAELVSIAKMLLLEKQVSLLFVTLLPTDMKEKIGPLLERMIYKFALLQSLLFDLIAHKYDKYKGGDNYDFDKDGFTENEGDCNDHNKKIHPKATEVCNGYDDNCKDGTDEDVKITFYLDSDGDTYGDPGVSIQGCKPPNPHYVADNTDCDDLDPARYPGAIEVCDDGKDNDCDDLTDCNDDDCTSESCCTSHSTGCPPPDYPDLTQRCDDWCIPADGICCHRGNGSWCDPGWYCCHNIPDACCPIGWECCGVQYCCDPGTKCVAGECVPK